MRVSSRGSGGFRLQPPETVPLPRPRVTAPKTCSRTASTLPTHQRELEGLLLVHSAYKIWSCPPLCISPAGPATAGCISEQH